MSGHKFPAHPLTEAYPLLQGAEFDELVEGIRARGQRLPVYLWNATIIDGRNRERACLAAAVKPLYEDVSHLKEADLPDFIDDLNLHRRHLDVAQQKKLRAARVERIARKRQQGRSLRVIAGEEGVSEAQVRADLKAATAQGCAVEPENGKVTGQDQRERPARRPPKEEVVLMDEPEPEEEDAPKSVGMALAQSAIACLERIPRDDAEREEGLQVVGEWIDSNL